MGRFIGIGILYGASFKKDQSKEAVMQVFPESLFDYSSFDEEHSIFLRQDIPSSELADLRSKVLDFCDLPREWHKDVTTDFKDVCFEEELDKKIRESTIEQLVELAEKKCYYSFQDSSQSEVIELGNKYTIVGKWYFLIYVTSFKYYASKGRDRNEITMKMERMIRMGLADNRLNTLVNCFITQ